MKIVFLKSAARDIAWFRHYYRAVFPEGRQNAKVQMRKIQTLLAANPQLGKPSEHGTEEREFSVPRTPFSLVYRVMPDQIEVIRLWDERQGRHE